MTYFKFKPRPAKTTERQKLIRKVDDAASEYVRLRDSDDEGIATCITCEDQGHYLRFDCGHYVPRSNMATRFDLRNMNAQCRLCNSTHDGRYDLHGEAIDRKHGEGTAAELERIGRSVKDFAEHELRGMLEELRKEIKALKIEKFES